MEIFKRVPTLRTKKHADGTVQPGIFHETGIFVPKDQNKKGREHWASDDETKDCHGCQKSFGLTVWKHHCRACGQIFCDACTKDRVMYTHETKLVDHSYIEKKKRVCSSCKKKLDEALEFMNATSDMVSVAVAAMMATKERCQSFEEDELTPEQQLIVQQLREEEDYAEWLEGARQESIRQLQEAEEPLEAAEPDEDRLDLKLGDKVTWAGDDADATAPMIGEVVDCEENRVRVRFPTGHFSIDGDTKSRSGSDGQKMEAVKVVMVKDEEDSKRLLDGVEVTFTEMCEKLKGKTDDADMQSLWADLSLVAAQVSTGSIVAVAPGAVVTLKVPEEAVTYVEIPKKKSDMSEVAKPSEEPAVLEEPEPPLPPAKPGAYLVYSESSNGMMSIIWSKTRVEGAYAYGEPCTAVPGFKYQGGGKWELQRNVNATKNNYYMGWVMFVKNCAKFDCIVTDLHCKKGISVPLPVVLILHNSSCCSEVHSADDNKPQRVTPAEPWSLLGCDAVAAVHHDVTVFNVATIVLERFMQLGKDFGASVEIEKPKPKPRSLAAFSAATGEIEAAARARQGIPDRLGHGYGPNATSLTSPRGTEPPAGVHTRKTITVSVTPAMAAQLNASKAE